MITLLVKIPWFLVIALCLTIGLAPFAPPHLVEKVGMLLRGELVRAIDWFDLFFHSAPWLLLLGKIIATVWAGN